MVIDRRIEDGQSLEVPAYYLNGDLREKGGLTMGMGKERLGSIIGPESRFTLTDPAWAGLGYFMVYVNRFDTQDAVSLRSPYFCLRACLFRFRIFFFRHFQRCFPRFFHAREPLFMNNLTEFDDDPNNEADSRGFEPRTTGLEGQRHIQTRPRAHYWPAIFCFGY